MKKPPITLLSQSGWMGPDGGVCAGPVIVHPDYERITGEKPPEGSIMAQPGDEDTTKIDIELIADELERTAKLAGRLKQTDIATEIGALVAKYREQAKTLES